MCLCQTVTNSSGGESWREAKKPKEETLLTVCINYNWEPSDRKLLKWETLSCNTVFQGKGRETVPELFQARLAGTVGNVGYCSRKALGGSLNYPCFAVKG